MSKGLNTPATDNSAGCAARHHRDGNLNVLHHVHLENMFDHRLSIKAEPGDPWVGGVSVDSRSLTPGVL
jgi:hypothetical protein